MSHTKKMVNPGFILHEQAIKMLCRGNTIDMIVRGDAKAGEEYGVLSPSACREMQAKGYITPQLTAQVDFARPMDENNVTDVREVAAAYNLTMDEARRSMIETTKQGKQYHNVRFSATEEALRNKSTTALGRLDS